MIQEEGRGGPDRDAPSLRATNVLEFMQVAAGDYLRARVEVSVGAWEPALPVE